MGEKDFNASYVGQRGDVERLIPAEAKLILDVGCSTGVLGAAIKAKTGARVFGIELSDEMAKEALGRIDKVFVGDATEIILQGALNGHNFDSIIFADVLEYLIDPWVTPQYSGNLFEPGRLHNRFNSKYQAYRYNIQSRNERLLALQRPRNS